MKNNNNTKDIIGSESNMPMTARLVSPGEGMGEWNEDFGRFMSMNVSGEPLVELYDNRNEKSDLDKSNLIARVSLSSLREEKESGKLIPKEFGVSNQDLKDIAEWAESFSEQKNLNNSQEAEANPKSAPVAESGRKSKGGNDFLSRLKSKIAGNDKSAKNDLVSSDPSI